MADLAIETGIAPHLLEAAGPRYVNAMLRALEDREKSEQEAQDRQQLRQQLQQQFGGVSR